MDGAFRLPLIPVLIAYALGIYSGYFDSAFSFFVMIATLPTRAAFSA